MRRLFEGIDRDQFVLGLPGARPPQRYPAAEGAPQLASVVRRYGREKPGDYVVCLGAGNITQWAYALPDELKALG